MDSELVFWITIGITLSSTTCTYTADVRTHIFNFNFIICFLRVGCSWQPGKGMVKTIIAVIGQKII